jgi:plastocyanin
MCLRHPERKGEVVVTAGGADSAVVQIMDSVTTVADTSGSDFDPRVVTVRPGGQVRWVNVSPVNHVIFTDRHCPMLDGCIVHRSNCDSVRNQEHRLNYPVGRYRFVDNEVKNGFLYFYAVTAFDSTTFNSVTTQLGGRRSAVEAEGVVPQVASREGPTHVWVVPNPYRGFARIGERPSAWDLTPNASDPTGTHIDFMGLPAGKWKIRIFTISGDLVQELHSDDPVNDSVRQPVTVNGVKYPGFNRQQDTPNDGQARWNLISRNGQDIVSGIYLFTVESDKGMQRGKFVIIR